MGHELHSSQKTMAPPAWQMMTCRALLSIRVLKMSSLRSGPAIMKNGMEIGVKLLDGVEMELPANRGVMLLNASGVRMDGNETDMETPKMLHDTI